MAYPIGEACILTDSGENDGSPRDRGNMTLGSSPNHVMEEGRDRRFRDNALLSQVDIMFQMCVNFQLKLEFRVAFIFEIHHVLSLSLNPFGRMIASWQRPIDKVTAILMG